jgi:hypothetical protein
VANFAHTGHGLVVLRNCCRDACAFLTPATAERYRSSASVSLSIHLQLSESSLLLSVELSTAAASYRRRCLFPVRGVTARRRCLGRRGSAVRGAGALCCGAGVVRSAGGRIHMSSPSSELLISIAARPSSAIAAGPSSAFAAVFVRGCWCARSSSLSLVDMTRLRRAGVVWLLADLGEVSHLRMSWL